MYLRSSDGMWRIKPVRGGWAVRRNGTLVATCRTIDELAGRLLDLDVDIDTLIED
jgi:hypothetical protein